MVYLSFSIGGTYFDYGIINKNGKVLKYHTQQVTKNQYAQGIIEQLFTVIEQMRIVEKIEGIAIATVGQVDADAGIILSSADIISDYSGLKLKKILEEKYQIPVEVENNVNCCGLAESWVGQARTLSNIYLLSIGNGVGGCSVIQHKIAKGRDFHAGEIGYIKFDGKPLSVYLQFPRLLYEVAQEFSLMPAEIDATKFLDLIQIENERVGQLVRNFIGYIAKAVAIVSCAVNPEAIFIGGIPKACIPYFSRILQEKLKEELTAYMYARVEVVFTPDIEKLRLIGAVKHFLEQQKKRAKINLWEIIKQAEKNFSKTDEKIAKYIANNIVNLSNMTINALGQDVGVSNPSITRFCQKIGLKSYQQLRVLAAGGDLDIERKINASYRPEILLQLRKKYQSLLANFEITYDGQQLVKMGEALKKAQNILLLGDTQDRLFLQQLSEVLNRKKYFTATVVIEDASFVESLPKSGYVIIFITPKIHKFFEQNVTLVQRVLQSSTGVLFTTHTQGYGFANFLEISLPAENLKDSHRLFGQQYLLDIFMNI